MNHTSRSFGPLFVLVLALLAGIMGVPAANAQVIETFENAGTSNWTVPANVTSITVEAWGGGGGGGGLETSITNARGGGGGAYARRVLEVTPGDNYTLTVGAGGAGGAGGDNPGSAGGASTFGSGPLVRAAGGSGGSAATSGAGGLGGLVADSDGDVLFLFRGGNANSGGGGGAGSSGAGGDATGATGGTGTTVGGGNGGSAATSGNSAGANGSAYGGGGSGARRQAGSARAGGAGAAGAIRITYSTDSPEPPPEPVCAVPRKDGDQSAAGIVNSYFPPVNGTFNSSSTAITLGTRRGATVNFNEGDLALVIQMQCANIIDTNTDNYGGNDGTGRGYSDPVGSCLAGRYEYVRAGAGTTASSLDLSETPLQGVFIQDAGTSTNRRTFQVIRVPQYGALTLSGVVTAEYWDGNTGGVVALDVADGLVWNGQTIDVSGRGFRGAGAWQWLGDTDTNDPPDYRRVFDAGNALRHAHKGEGIAGTPRVLHDQENGNRLDLGTTWGGYVNGDTARGAPANAGGGGNNRNSVRDNGGGGGGGNGGIGGFGGYGWKSAGWGGVFSTADFDLRGIGGAAFATPAPNRVVMGGGGGAGGTNNDGDNPRAKGGAGGGIVIVRARSMTGTGVVNALGADGETMPENDAAGGAGAGGSVVLMSYDDSGLGAVSVDVSGGAGGDGYLTGDAAHAGGGGGAGGVVIRSHAATTVDVSGGTNGVTNPGGDPVDGVAHGATPGGPGVDTLQDDSDFLVLPGGLCGAPPSAVVLGEFELEVMEVPQLLHTIGAGDADNAGLLALLQTWDPGAAAALAGAGREQLSRALVDHLDPDGDGRVAVLRWETLEEIGTMGFYVDRRDGRDWTRINSTMLPAMVGAHWGGEYWLADPGARPGGSYQYRLIEIEARGTTQEYGPFELRMGGR